MSLQLCSIALVSKSEEEQEPEDGCLTRGFLHWSDLERYLRETCYPNSAAGSVAFYDWARDMARITEAEVAASFRGDETFTVVLEHCDCVATIWLDRS